MGTSQSKTEKFQETLESRLESIYPSPYAYVIKVKSRKPTKPALHRIERITLDAQPIEGTNEKVVNARDGRVQVKDTTDWPNSAHGLLTMKFKDSTCWGTGIMIGPNIVLTAGHNLYDYERKVYADLKNLKFLPGMDGDILPFGSVGVKQYFVSPNYIKEEKEDYAVLILDESIGDRTGYFGLACLKSEEIKAKRINVFGYPYDKVKYKPGTYEMWGMEGSASVVNQDKGVINYLIDTWQGQSGSGVWYQEGGDYYVCGVHVSGTNIVNTATLLTRAMYQQIHKWVHQGNFEHLLGNLKDGTELKLQRQEIDIECLRMMMRCRFENMTILDLSWNEIEDEGAKILAGNTSWVNLSYLDLRENNIGAEGAKELAKNISWINLSNLNLSYNNIGTEGAKELAKNNSWIKLSYLYLSRNNIGVEGAKELAKNISWINLSELHLINNNIGAEGAKELANNTSWINLSELDLSYNNIGAEGAKELAKNISWINLSELHLFGNNIGAEGAKELAKNISWINLSNLNLSYNNIGTEGAKELAKNISWINLSKLNLFSNRIGAEGAKELAKNISWINLSELNLFSNRIGAEGAKELAKNTSWINLSKLDLSDNNIDAEEVKLLRENKIWKKNIRIWGI